MQSGLHMDAILIGFLIVFEQYAQNSMYVVCHQYLYVSSLCTAYCYYLNTIRAISSHRTDGIVISPRLSLDSLWVVSC